ncbi:hypothetical protein L596_028879 [Steinernema carpocapsae]|uniref:Uncharacterized protein n=1 Tax=Steinernema carpocapsae TaxID=34508 RepID=A0A4U5LZN6_STECR|nr:hypothetical protein L596_028879 [Steinernema carpocapsae]
MDQAPYDFVENVLSYLKMGKVHPLQTHNLRGWWGRPKLRQFDRLQAEYWLGNDDPHEVINIFFTKSGNEDNNIYPTPTKRLALFECHITGPQLHSMDGENNYLASLAGKSRFTTDLSLLDITYSPEMNVVSYLSLLSSPLSSLQLWNVKGYEKPLEDLLKRQLEYSYVTKVAIHNSDVSEATLDLICSLIDSGTLNKVQISGTETPETFSVDQIRKIVDLWLNESLNLKKITFNKGTIWSNQRFGDIIEDLGLKAYEKKVFELESQRQFTVCYYTSLIHLIF